jgi:hypothetical protein
MEDILESRGQLQNQVYDHTSIIAEKDQKDRRKQLGAGQNNQNEISEPYLAENQETAETYQQQ